jgi:hypothetical protein
VSSAGLPNYGDELIVAQWLRYLKVRAPEAEVFVDAPSPGSAEVLLGHLHPRVRFVDTLFQVCWAAASEDPWEVAHFAAEATRHPGVVPSRAAGVDLLHTVDVFHLVGGGYLTALWPRYVALISAGQVLVEDFGVRAATSGLGLIPSAASGALLDRLTRDYAVVDVRDTESRKLLTGDNVSETGDDVFLDIAPHLYDRRDTREVMLCLQSDLVDAGVGALAEMAMSAMAQWGVDGSQVGYVEAIPGADRRVFDLIEPLAPEIRFYPFTEIWREGLPARRGQRWLTTRFHPHLLAAAVGASGLAVSVKPGYYDVKHESLISRGSRWDLAEAGAPVAPIGTGAGFFDSEVDSLVQTKQELAERIYAA